MEDHKLIDYTLRDPANSFFKAKANERAELRAVYCKNLSCPLLQKGQCVMSGSFPVKCKEGSRSSLMGPTKRAKSYNKFIREAREIVEGVNKLKAAEQKMVSIGDQIYFPYPFWYMNRALPEEIVGSAWRSRSWIPVQMFNAKLLHRICSSLPQAMMGGEIKSFQREVVPKIITHLKEVFPGIYEELKAIDPELCQRQMTNIGRKALLATIAAPCTISLKEGSLNWDGEILKGRYKILFQPIKGDTYLTIHPDEDATIEITSEDQVSERTKFLD